MFIPTNVLLSRLLAEGLEADTAPGTPGPLHLPFVGLFTGAPPLSGTTTAANVTEAAFTGYARQQITAWTAGFLAQDGRPGISSSTSLFWQPTAPVLVGSVCTGWALYDSAAPDAALLGAEYFAKQAPMQQATDALSLDVFIGLAAAAGMGYGTVVN